MEKFRIGVFLDENYKPQIGGGFSYQNYLVSAIDEFNFSKGLDIVFVSFLNSEIKGFRKQLVFLRKKIGLKFLLFKAIRRVSQFGYPLLKPLNNELNKIIEQEQNLYYEKQLIENEIQIIYYLVPGVRFENFPFIATNWDLGHRTLPPLPEVAMDGIYESREHYYQYTLNKALIIIAESEEGKKELTKYYKYNEEKIKVFPMFPGRVVKLSIPDVDVNHLLNHYGLKNKNFFFYPAQFWSHKNHFNLLKAFKIVKEKTNNDLRLVLTGSDQGNYSYIKDLIYCENLSESVLLLDFVPIEHIYCFYKGAIALVMPTLLGPTNMPLMEALALGCPVLCSNLVGHIDQMKDSATYFDPFDCEDIAIKMLEAIMNEKTNSTQPIEMIYEPQVSLLEEYFLTAYSIRKLFYPYC